MLRHFLGKLAIIKRSPFRNIALGVLAAGLLAGAFFIYAWYARSHRDVSQVHGAALQHTKAAAIVTAPGELLTGTWSNLPGATRQKDGSLLIAPRDFKIVAQDGSGGQPNPPVNLAGTRLQITGDFTLTAALTLPVGTQASLQLYGGVPIIADEFRIEPKSLRFTLDAKSLTVQRWDGTGNQPAATQTFPCLSAATNSVRIERVDGSVVISLNGKQLGSVSPGDTFASGAVWFGLASEGGNWQLASLTALGRNQGAVTAVDASKIVLAPKVADGLQTLATGRRPGFLIGTAVALAPTVSDAPYASVLFGGNFGLITTENALKWQFVHPSPGVYDFHEGDALVALAKQQGLKVHGHTLVFGEANPQWVRALPADQREQAMLDHIATVVGHYKGKISSWDVVNEPFDDDQWDQLRPNIWEQAMGESYIPKAFTAARAADPNAQLFMNDYGLEEDGDRWDAFLGLVTQLKKQGVPIDGVGFQSHVYVATDKINPAVLRTHIRQLAAIGLKARVSEMDVYSEDGQSVQAQQYSGILQACLAEPACVSFTTWGFSDRYDWFIDDDGSVQQGQDLLWDKNMHPTPAVTAMRQALH